MTPAERPTREGHFWAMLESHPEPDLCSPDWEVVQVFDNNGEGDEAFMVSVPGVSGASRLGDFRWGPPVHKPAELGVGDQSETEAAARLSAAAPELLEALVAAEAFIRERSGGGETTFREAVLLPAIAKALTDDGKVRFR